MAKTTTQARSEAPPLLLLIDRSDELHALVRSGSRRVMRWSPDAGAAACFGGDPTRAETYECAHGARSVTAVLDLPDADEARRALAALRRARPDAAVLVLSGGVEHAPGDGTLTRAGSLRDVLRLDLEEELQRLEAERRTYCLRRFVGREGLVPILIHPDPDPDAISSASALRTVLQRPVDELPIVTLGQIRRPENRRMAELLGVRVTEVTLDELRAFERLITVDMQPAGMFDGNGPELAVIDHHPAETGYTAQFCDVRPEYGAVATMVTEYLRAGGESKIGELLATALLHGIKTDTDSLTRGVSPDDVQAYAFLQGIADLNLLRRIERPTYTAAAAHRFGTALATLREADGIVLAYAGELEEEESHLLPELADFCLGLEQATTAVATGYVEDELVLTLRYAGHTGPDAGELARRIAADGGKGGGHAQMARAVIARSVAKQRFGDEERELPERVLRYLRQLAR